MKLLAFDTETTGLKPESGDKIIEIALLTYDTETRQLVDKYVQRIDPECPISPGAQEVHGISYESLIGKPKFRHIAAEVKRRFEEADLVIAHNLDFDVMFLICEFSAIGDMIPERNSFDTMTEARWACSDGKLPKLGELCFALGVEYDDTKAHAADYDVEVMTECFWRGLDRGFYKLPEGLAHAQ